LIVISDIQQIKKKRNEFKNATVGFIPTMGSLHPGHISLVERAREENEIVFVSIFINPTQFDSKEDLNHYPSVLDDDLAILEKFNIDFVFTPKYDDLYPDHFAYKVEESDFSKELCGASRNGHFTGVLSVVMKLLNIVSPTKAYFGEKDRQQLLLIKGMVEAFFLEVEIVASPTIREIDGLAMSSRNLRLNLEERKIASKFPALLRSNKSDQEISEELNKNGFRTDYIETINGIRYGAVVLGNVRLIDNDKS